MRPEIADHGPATWTDRRPQDTAHRGGGRVMTTLDLELIKDRLAKAHTEWGEWSVQSDEWGECHHVVIRDDEPGYSIIAEGIGQGEDDGLADATFIAEAPSDIAALIAEVERLRGQIEGLRAIIDSHPNPLECGKHDDDDPVSCGWKIAYTQIVQQIGEGKAA